MRNRYFILCVCILLFASCKGRFYKAGSTSMQNTIMAGESFYVQQASSFNRNDIVAFDFFGNDYSSMQDENGNFPQHWEKRIYRIVAFSGDTLQIQDGNFIINRKDVPHPPAAAFEYDVYSTVSIDDFPGNEPMPQQMNDENGTIHYTVTLTKQQADAYLQRKPAITDVKRVIRQYDINDTFIAKPSDSCHWSVDNFGPLRIPLPGETVIVDAVNFKLYHNIPGIKIGKNIIKEKLYFLVGDNFHGAEDSRYTGYISHSSINGIVKE